MVTLGIVLFGFQVPNGDVNKLQGNFWVNNFISLLSISSPDKSKKPLNCQNCDSGDAAVSHCADCGVFMCDFCVKAHRRMHAFKNHQIVSIDEMKSGSAKALIKPSYCEKHAGETLKLFCQTCDWPICRDCTIIDHQGHKYAFVADAVDKEKGAVRELLKKTKSKAPALAEGVKAVEEMEERVKAKEQAVTREIEDLKKHQVGALERMFAELTSRAKSIGQAKLKQLQAQRESLMMALASVNNSVEFTEHALRDGGDVEVLSMKKQLVTNLSKLGSATWECEPCEQDAFRLTVHQDIAQVAAHLATVDDVRADPTRCTLSMVGGDPGLIYDTWAGQKREFVVSVQDNFGNPSSGERVQVSIIGPGGGQSSGTEVLSSRVGSYAFAYVPRSVGRYQLTVRVTGQDIPGSPFQWNVIQVPQQVGQGAAQGTSLGSSPTKLSLGARLCYTGGGYYFGDVVPTYEVGFAQACEGGGYYFGDVAPTYEVGVAQACEGRVSWKIKIIGQDFLNSEKAGIAGLYGEAPRVEEIFAIESTGGSSVPNYWQTPQNGITSWKTGDVFVLFQNTDTGTLRIQNLRTSETAVFSGVFDQGCRLSPYWDPDDSNFFSLDA